MDTFLDKSSYDFSDPAARALRDFLSTSYFRVPEIIRFVQDAGIDAASINWEQAARLAWTDTLRRGAQQKKNRTLVQTISNSGDAAVAIRLQEFLSDSPVEPAPEPASTWKAPPMTAELERQTASQPTLLDVTFLERGTELARGVVRLLVTMPSGKRYNGSGFLIGPDLILTNHHVLFDVDHGGGQATKVEVWFGYERAFAGVVRPHVTIDADPATIHGSDPEQDWATLRIDTAKVPESAVVIDVENLGSVGVDDRVYIIQHPNGGPKQIGMIHNVVRLIDDDVIQYLTDTEGGSSGSPVFDEQWQLVALHHRGREIQVGGGTEIRNQGRRMTGVLVGLKNAGVR